MTTHKIQDLDTAIRIYYECYELGNKEIAALFGAKSSATLVRIKKIARDYMLTNDIRQFGFHAVNTKAAFEAWGLDIEDLEKRRAKLIKLGLHNKSDEQAMAAHL